MSVTGDLKQSPFLTLPPDITALVNTNEKEEKKKLLSYLLKAGYVIEHGLNTHIFIF